MNRTRTYRSALNVAYRMRVVVVAALSGIVAAASADTTPVSISTTANVRAYAFWQFYELGESGSNEEFGINSAYAAASGWGAQASARITVSDVTSHSQVDTTLTSGGPLPTWSDAIAEVQSGAVTIGTSAAYPAGTPLLLNIAAYTTGDDVAVTNTVDLQLMRGSDLEFSFHASGQLAPTEWTVVVYAGETLTPWIKHYFTTDDESGESNLHVDMWTAVPEPATFMLLMLGGLALRRR